MNKAAHIQHIDRVLTVVDGGTIGDESTCNDLIRRSWKRCIKDYGLDPAQRRSARIVPSQKLREHQEQIEEFLRVARAGMEQMYKRISGSGYVLLLSDAQGVTVDYIGSDTAAPELKSAGLYLGADWNETYAGTCAVGTCLVEQKPITCHQDEHFDVAHIGLTCTSAPLFDPEGKFLAVLDMSALQSPSGKESQLLAVHLTSMYAQMIEDANFLRHFRHAWILRLGTTWELVDVSGDAMLAFNEEGVIVGANTGARHLFASTRHASSANEPVGQTLDDLFGKSVSDIWRVARSSHGGERSLITSGSSRSFYISVVHPQRSSASRITTAVSAERAYPALDRLAGEDLPMQRLLDQAKRLVNRRLNILIHGETGTGKEVLAKALHESSSRARMPFIAVNCAAIPESLIESELFGYSPGTFTGGRNKGMKGLILQSDGGTLFLDEIGDMPLHLQTRLLRVLSEREVVPLGAEKAIPLDLTVVAASHRDLRNLISEGKFREDLYYRLCGATLHLPPLRDRADRQYLIEKMLHEEAVALDTTVQLSDDALQLLLQFPWPGNARQLRNVLRYAVAVADNDQILPEHLPKELTDMASPDATILLPSTSAGSAGSALLHGLAPELEAEGRRLLMSLRQNKWNITAVSTELNICRATVYRQMRKFGIVPPNQQA
ncbi:MAG TPA: sigma-54-dependent Fis family transcriptional regulator [Noviherbaspirillum sp.]|uniref:sigma-54-dependent Fis family transcriptional regulator n=1 Tax=Noviherbaspirillum sp. TaxID=1926288 RepID=UPI002B477828|nr:sigma-54-dependent Fis family transcriptional regulator [Noviherbaspirillum sp.]HJV84067.1 sigma-54-dependent Fis family transcriptional regulator [Noviherbaspirillum sp.]